MSLFAIFFTSLCCFPTGEMRKVDDLISKAPPHSKFLFILYLIKRDKTFSWVETMFSVRSTHLCWLPNVSQQLLAGAQFYKDKKRMRSLPSKKLLISGRDKFGHLSRSGVVKRNHCFQGLFCSQKPR